MVKFDKLFVHLVLAGIFFLLVVCVAGFLDISRSLNNARVTAMDNIYSGRKLSAIPNDIPIKEYEADKLKTLLPSNFIYGDKLYGYSSWTTNCYFSTTVQDGEEIIKGIYFEHT